MKLLKMNRKSQVRNKILEKVFFGSENSKTAVQTILD